MTTDALLRAILSMTARVAIPVKELAEIIMPKDGMESQLDAYNLCDGNRSQGEVARIARLDASNFSKTVSRWMEAGVVVRLGEGRDATLLHIYPLSKEAIKKDRAR